MIFNKSPKFSALVLGAIGIYGVSKSFYTVEGGHRGVVFNQIYGIKEKVYEEGTHFIIPFIEKPITYDVRRRAHLVKTICSTHDLYTVRVFLRVLTRPMADQLPRIYQDVGLNYIEVDLPSIVKGTMTFIVSKYSAAELFSKREEVMTEARKIIMEKCSTFSIEVDDVSVTSLTFVRSFSAATIDPTLPAAQQVERATTKVLQQIGRPGAPSTSTQVEGEDDEDFISDYFRGGQD